VAIKIKIPNFRAGKNGSRIALSLSNPLIRAALAALALILVICLAVFSYYWNKYDRMVEQRIRGPIFTNSARIYARPRAVSVGDRIESQEIVSELRRAGYTEGAKSEGVGTYKLADGAIQIKPGPLSYHNEDGASIQISGGKVTKITAGGSAGALSAYELEPPLLTALDAEERAKRQVVHYQEIPKVMVDAVLAIEDRRFFQHGGVNFVRLFGAALFDLRERHKGQGGSTLTMQISRGFFLTPEKTVKRKLTEMMIAIDLEHKLNKQQIFELYANQVDMGQRGSFTIHGFAEASRSYFNKDLQSITLPEAALLAGIIQRPSYLNPYRHPERALDRRNLVLESMVDTGAITREQADKAKAVPLKLAPPNVEASDAPYFVDLVREFVGSRYGEKDVNEQQYKVYTTLDPELQRAAAEAVETGIKLVDQQVTKLRTKKTKIGTGKNAKVETTVASGPIAQVALIVMDPHTGEVLALVGGRNYGMSQLNHAVKQRPTGSIFKPFVYATAVNTAVVSSPTVVTPASMLDDTPGTFIFDRGTQVYEPHNYKQEYHDQIPAEYALAHSLNNATVRLAEQVGYSNVATMAKAAGIKSVQATPAIALGAYDATPLDMSSAYTVFANGGVRLSPVFVKSVHSSQGEPIENFSADKTVVLDPRVAYVMTTMMENVINTGTGYPVRQFGFTAPAAGKTGTSHDGWFAGYTTKLLCVVWVGFDDYSDLKLSGSATAAPIWAEFMKRAVKIPAYSTGEFPQPAGVVNVRLDKVTNRLATAACPDDYYVAFIAGTEPTQTCEQNEGGSILTKILGVFEPKPPSQNSSPPVNNGQPAIGQPGEPMTGTALPVPPDKKKKGFFGKLAGVFKGDKDEDKNDGNKTQPPPQQSPQ